MADHAELRGIVWAALAALPRPVDYDVAQRTCTALLESMGNRTVRLQMDAWWERHGADVVRSLNGG